MVWIGLIFTGLGSVGGGLGLGDTGGGIFLASTIKRKKKNMYCTTYSKFILLHQPDSRKVSMAIKLS